MSQKAIAVSEFINRIKGTIESVPYFNNAWVVGEVSNFKKHSSGHLYFKIKDTHSSMDCVMFKTQAQKVLFAPKDGDKIVIRGSLGVYEARGSMQIYVSAMNLDGLGDLYIRLEALKKEFHEKGYFKPELKRPLPLYPRTIGVVTGNNSAAYADISRTLLERWPVATVSYEFAIVQGEQAPQSIISSLELLKAKAVEVVILARGGGSIEDLWGFNDPQLIEYLHTYPIPFVSGVGHESDTTLVDYISDYEAATPTAAAVKTTPKLTDVYNTIRDYKNMYYKNTVLKLRKNQEQLVRIKQSRWYLQPHLLLDKHQMRLDRVESTILKQSNLIALTKMELETIIKNQQNSLINTINRNSNWVNSHTTNYQTHLTYFNKHIEDLKQSLSHVPTTLLSSVNAGVELKKRKYVDIIKVIDLLSPFKIMQRGFSLVYLKDNLVKSSEDVSINDNITIKLDKGNIGAIVKEIIEYE